MKGFRTCLSFALSFALLSTVLFTAPSASAASPYDGLKIGFREEFMSQNTALCSAVNMATQWYQGFAQTYNKNTSDPQLVAARESINASLNAGGAWWVSQAQNPTSGDNFMYVYWLEPSDMATATDLWSVATNPNTGVTTHYLTIQTTSGHAVNMARLQYGRLSDNSCGWYQYNSSLDNYLTYTLATDTSANIEYYTYINFPFANIPSGYAGPALIQSISTREILRPDISWDVNNKKITIKDVSDPIEFVKPYKLHLIVTEGTIESQPIFYTGSIVAGGTTTVDISNYNHVSIQASFINTDESAKIDTLDYDFREAVVTFDVDGTVFSGTTVGRQCDSNNWCTTGSIAVYEECTLGDVLCYFRNAGVWLKKWLGIEEYSDIATNPFNSFTTDTHGLTAVITAPLVFIQSLSAANCSPITIPMAQFGTMTAPCMSEIYSSKFATFYAIAQVIINALVGYYVMVRVLEIVKGFKDPQNDRIEVTQL